MPNSRTILLVDDSKDDRVLLKRAFFKAGILNPVQEVNTGNEAIQYLRGDGVYQDRVEYPFPGIVLLDLNMPGIDGFGVLEWMRGKMTVQGVLVIVLSRHDETKQINRAYALGANSFLTKPGPAEELEGLIISFRDYWLMRNKPPQITEPGGRI
jgi:CheY-like chemotaxis protein